MARPSRELDKIKAALAAAEDILERSPPSAAADAAKWAAVRLGKDFEPKELELALARPRVGTAQVLTCDAFPGRILLGARKGSHGEGKWATPGGHLEGGESWAVCSMRELQEETGLDLPADRFAFVGATNDIMTAEGLHYITIFLHAPITPAEAARITNAEPEKCLGWHWLTLDEVASKPLFVPCTNALKEGLLATLLQQQQAAAHKPAPAAAAAASGACAATAAASVPAACRCGCSSSCSSGSGASTGTSKSDVLAETAMKSLGVGVVVVPCIVLTLVLLRGLRF